MEAMKEALEYVEERLDEGTAESADIVLFTDSLSALQALEGLSVRPTPLEKTMSCVERLRGRSRPVNCVFQWILSHVSVGGNERVDQLAKLGTNLPSPGDQPVSLESIRAKVSDWTRKKWLKCWERSPNGRELWKHMEKPDRSDQWWTLRREEQSVLARFRVGHALIGSYFARIRE